MASIEHENQLMTERTNIDLKTAESRARAIEEAREVLMAGFQDHVLNQPLFNSHGLAPKFSRTAVGCRVEDDLNHCLIDWTGGRSSKLLGHRHPVVVEAISNWAAEGTVDDEDFPVSREGSLCDPRETSLSRKLAGLFNSGNLVEFTCGRRESIFSAMEIARVATGRKKILWPQLHVNRELFVENQVFKFGQTNSGDELLVRYEFDNMANFNYHVSQHSDEIAAVVMYPFGFDFPDIEYFKRLQHQCKANGILLIFDETDTAFRFELGGAQAHFGVSPDLTIVGDSLGGQFGFSAVIGRQESLTNAWWAAVRAVDRPGGLVLSAVEAALDCVIEENLPNRLTTITEQLRSEFELAVEQSDVDCRLVGFGNRLSFQFGNDEIFSQENQRKLFSTIALDNGLLTFGELWPNASHDDLAVDETIRALEKSLITFSQTLAAKTARAKVLGWSASSTPQEKREIGAILNKAEIRGRIDSLLMIRKTLVAVGWILVDDIKIDEFVGYLEDGTQIVAEPMERLDLGNAFPQFPDAVHAGFKLSLPVESIKKPSRFLVVAMRDGDVVYQALMVHEPSKQSAAPYRFGSEVIFT